MTSHIRRRLAYGALAAFLLVSGCSDESPDALIQSAKQYIAKNDQKAAAIQLKSALQKAPNSPDARFLLGRVLLDAGDPVSAEVELRKALGLGYSPKDTVPALARAMLLEGQYRKLATEFGDTYLPDPVSQADLKTSLATALAREGKTAAANQALDSALGAVPGYGRARVLRARLMADAQNATGALALVDAVLRDDSRDYEAWQCKGDLEYGVGHDPAAALDAYRRALEIRGDLVPARVMILALLIEKNDIAGAKRELAEWKKTSPNHPEVKFVQAELALSEHDFKSAREITQQLLQIAPNNVKVLFLAGSVEYQSGSLLQAQNFLGKALNVAPEATPIRRLLAQAYLRSGQSDKVFEVLAPMLQSKDPDAQVLSLAAQTYLLSGDPKSAEAYFSRVAALDPADTRSQTALALGQFAKGNPELGFARLEEIAASDKGSMADLALISASLRQGKFDVALKAIDSLERKQGQPGAAMAANLRGRVHLLRNDPSAARRSFERAVALDPLYLPALVSLARLDVADKKPEVAKQRFDRLLSADPRNVGALLALAELRSQAGASEQEMVGLFSNVVRLNPAEMAPRLLLIETHIRRRDLKAALAAAEDAVAALPGSPELWNALGSVQLALGDTNAGLASTKKAVELSPRSPEPYVRLGSAYIALGKVDDARQSIQRALALSPDLLVAQRALILLEMSTGRPKQALEIARRMQTVPANRAAGLLFEGDVEGFQGNWPAAVTAYRAGLKVSDSAELAIKLYSALLASSLKAEANAFAADWAKRHPQNAAFFSYMGDLALAKADYAGAVDNFAAVVRLQPDNAIALNNLAWATHKLGMPGALAFIEKANALQPDQPSILDTLATVLADSGEMEKAIDREKRAVELSPQQHPFRLNLAKLYIKAGKKGLARNELDELAKIGNAYPRQDEVERLLKSL
jgi:putative PEP-CTERM system TPR-repeat lipoprotein